MRTIEEVLGNAIGELKPHSIDPFTVYENMKKVASLAIREYAIVCIRSAADKIIPDGNPLSAKQSILSLIDEIK